MVEKITLHCVGWTSSPGLSARGGHGGAGHGCRHEGGCKPQDGPGDQDRPTCTG